MPDGRCVTFPSSPATKSAAKRALVREGLAQILRVILSSDAGALLGFPTTPGTRFQRMPIGTRLAQRFGIVFVSAMSWIEHLRPLPAQQVFEGLLARGILVKNVARPGCLDGCLRITVGTSAENQRCAAALREVTHDLRA